MTLFNKGRPPRSVAQLHDADFLNSIRDAYNIYRQIYKVDIDYPDLPPISVIQYTSNSAMSFISTGIWLQPLGVVTYLHRGSLILSEVHNRIEYTEPKKKRAKKRHKIPICVFGCHFQYYLITPYGVILPGTKNGVPVTFVITPDKSYLGVPDKEYEEGLRSVAELYSFEHYAKSAPGRVPFNILLPYDAPTPLFAATHLPQDAQQFGLMYRAPDHDMYSVRYYDRQTGNKRDTYVAVLKPNPKAIAMLCAFTYRAAETRTCHYTMIEGGIEEQLYEACLSHRYFYPCTNRVGHVKIGRMVRAYYESKDWQVPRPIDGL